MTRSGTNTTKTKIKQLKEAMSQDEDFLRTLVATVVQEVLEAEPSGAR